MTGAGEEYWLQEFHYHWNEIIFEVVQIWLTEDPEFFLFLFINITLHIDNRTGKSEVFSPFTDRL